MKVSSLIDFAVKGEITTLDVADISVDNVGRQNNIDTLISYINLALLELYKKFILKRGKLVLADITDGIVTTLESDFMSIVIAVGNDDDLTPVPLDDELVATLSVNQISPFELEIHKTTEDTSEITEITIFYSRSPVLLKGEEDDVPINDQFITPILNYIAYKAYTPTDGVVQDSNNIYYQRFEAACNVLTVKGLLAAPTVKNTNLNDRGFT